MRDVLKQTFDRVVAAGALIALGALMLALAVAIKRSSPGPVFFRQQRVGRGGLPFWLYKFRTMYAGARGPGITTGGDTRITPMGRWLRHWKLDELPQLVNVLRGEMSLVGPRPEVPQYVRADDPDYQRVLSVRPGLTGPSQVRFRDEECLLAAQPDPETYYVTTVLPAKLAIDLEYVRSRSLLGDLQILLGTLCALWRPAAEREGQGLATREHGGTGRHARRGSRAGSQGGS